MTQIKGFYSNAGQLKLVFTTGLCFLILLGITACQSNAEDEGRSSSSMDSTLTQTAATNDQSPEEKYALAKEAHNENPDDPDALIWFGRRAAYLGHYDEAIDIFTSGIKSHPEDARMYRHRGHRYISTRQYDKAIVDFEKAVTLIAGQADEVEPDGLPNSRNIPLSTLHGNIWYHLGLACYLKNDMDNALRAFCNRTVTEWYDDNIVSGGLWLFMILSRQGKTEEANEAISAVHPKMDIIENDSYYQMCLFYKNLIPESELIMDDPTSSSANVLNYGLGNWYLYQKQDTATAKKYYAQLLETGNKYAFAYLAAESDWERLFQED